MNEFLNKLFNIRPSEWPRVVVLFFIIMLTDAAAILGATIAYAAFLQQGGIESLPWVLGVNSLLSIFAIAIYTAFVDRIANDTLMIAIYAMSAVGIVFGLGLLWLGFTPLIAYSLLYLVDLALTPAFGSHVTTYVNGFYDIQAAKRVVPAIFAGSRAGIIFGGLTLSFLTDWLTPEGIIMIWFLTYIGIIILMRSIPRLLKQEKSQSHQTEKPSPPPINHTVKKSSIYIDNLKEGLRYIVQSGYLRWMTIGTFLFVVLMALIEYKSSEILLGIYGTSEELASFLAILIGLSSIIGLPILLFVISRVITYWGVGNTSLLFPICNLFVCGGLIVSPGLISAATAYLNRSTLRSVLQFPVDGLLYNAVPLRVKGRARAFVTGLIVPVGTLLGSVLLLTPGVSTTWWVIPGLIGFLAVSYVVTAAIIRQQYRLALIKMLEQEDYSFLLSQEASNLIVTDPATLRQLQKKLQGSTNTEFKLFMAQLISQVGGPKAISMLIQEARTAEDTRIRAAIIDILVAADFRDDTLRQLYTDLLSDPAGSVRQSAISGLSRLADLKDEQFLSLMLGMIHDPDFNVQNQALLLLASSDTFYQLSPAVEVLEQFLKSPEPSQRVYGVRILGQIGDEQSIRRVFDFLDDSSDEVRLRAAITLEKLSSRTEFVSFIPMLVENMESLLRDPVERVRQAALTLCGKMDVAVSNQPLIFALRDPSPRIRATAADALVQIGKSIIPVIHPHLNSGDPQVRKMTAVILSRVHPGEFKILVTGTTVMGNLLTIYRNYGLMEAFRPYSHFTGVTILHCTLHEQNQHMLEEVFYLLEAIQDPSSIKLIQESLKNEDPHIRANAIEALESFSTPQIATLIAPLFSRDIVSTEVLSLSKETWDMEPPDIAQAFRQLLTSSEDSWLRTITAFVLGQMTFSSDQSDSEKRLDIEKMLDIVDNDPVEEVRLAPQTARRMMNDFQVIDRTQKENIMLSTIEKVIFLKQVSFFEEMTIEQLNVLANVCEERFFAADTWLFHQGDAGGTLYVVVNGRVGIEQEKRKGSSVRVNTLDAYAYFGEVTVFDASVYTAGAIAIQDTIILRLGREPLLALARQYPELSLKLIYALNKRLRQAYDRIGELSRSRPRKLHKLFDQFE